MIVGIDLGSSRIKQTMLSMDGNVLASKSSCYSEVSADLLSRPSEWTEDAVLEVLREQISSIVGAAGEPLGHVEAICISATAPDFWILSDPLAQPSGRWCDGFSSPPNFDEKDIDAAAAAAGSEDPWQIEFCLRSIAARRTLGELPNHATYQTRHGWLFTLLTGLHELDSATALELGKVYNPDVGDWDMPILREVLGSVRMPIVRTAGSAAYSMKPQVAAKLGLNTDTLVVLGTCDSLCSMIAAGCLERGDAFIYYGTYFCAADTDIGAYLEGSSRVPFSWRLSMPFAGRTLERLTCVLYGGEARDAFSALNTELSKSPRTSVTASNLQRGRKPFIWEEASFSFSGIDPSFRRIDLLQALLSEFGANLAQAFYPTPTEAWISGGAARSPQIVDLVGSAAGIQQNIIQSNVDAIGTALLALRAINPKIADAKLRSRRSTTR